MALSHLKQEEPGQVPYIYVEAFYFDDGNMYVIINTDSIEAVVIPKYTHSVYIEYCTFTLIPLLSIIIVIV